MRKTKIERKTKETEIEVELNLDGTGKYEINTGIGFFDHVLTALSKYSLIDMKISAKGDLGTGTHHTIEDVGITIGLALAKALAEKRGISRAGFFQYMMDDALVESAIDLSGRGRLIFENRDGQELKFSNEVVGSLIQGFQSEEIKEFFWGIAENSRSNISIRLMRSGNAHHEIEASFKAFGKALRQAISIDERIKNKIPSTKGVI